MSAKNGTLKNGRDAPTGPTPKLQPEIHERIISAIETGCNMETAFAFAGVNVWTFRDWLRRGRADIELKRSNRYTRLVEDIDHARAKTEVTRVARIMKAGMEGDWKADAWWLEHALQDRYAIIRQKLEGTIKVQPQPLVDVSKLTLEEQVTLRNLLEKGAPDADDPALSERARPALELIEGEVIDGEIVSETG